MQYIKKKVKVFISRVERILGIINWNEKSDHQKSTTML